MTFLKYKHFLRLLCIATVFFIAIFVIQFENKTVISLVPDVKKKRAPFMNSRKFLRPPSNDSNCGYLVTGHWEGRLGNHMFAYAAFYGIVKRQRDQANKTAIIDVDKVPSLISQAFESLTIAQQVLPPNWYQLRNFTTAKETSWASYDDSILSEMSCNGENILVSGYRMNVKYFWDEREDIKREFTFRPPIREKCQNLLKSSMSSVEQNRRCTNVGVHLRRGDFLDQANLERGHWPVDLDYLQNAVHFYEVWYFDLTDEKYSFPINHTKSNKDCLVFVVFGDDNAWNANATTQLQLLRPNLTHFVHVDSKKSEAAVDMCALSLSNHLIISTGSFGWWAAFFNKGMVVYQKQYARPGSNLYKEFLPKEYFLEHWIGL